MTTHRMKERTAFHTPFASETADRWGPKSRPTGMDMV